MKAKKLEDLQIYQKALEGNAAVSPPGHIAEGFGQLTDKHFAHYLGIARGSAQETRGHLASALGKERISVDDESRVSDLYRDLCNMLTAFIATIFGAQTFATVGYQLWTLDSGLWTFPFIPPNVSTYANGKVRSQLSQ